MMVWGDHYHPYLAWVCASEKHRVKGRIAHGILPTVDTSQPIHAAGDLMGLRWFMVQVRLNTVDLNMAMMAPMNPALDMIF